MKHCKVCGLEEGSAKALDCCGAEAKAPPPKWRKPFGIVIARYYTTRFGKMNPPRRWYRWYKTADARAEALRTLMSMPRYVRKAWRLGTIEGRPGEFRNAAY